MNKENIRIILEYDGTNYHGWQKQDNALTIQTIVEKAIEDLTQENVNLIAAGRTDTGVHARGQVANFYLQKKMPIYKISKGLNACLPEDIVVKKAEKAEKAFAWVSHFAKTTPYELENVATAFSRLKAYGMDATKFLPVLGDTASAMGKDIMKAV